MCTGSTMAQNSLQTQYQSNIPKRKLSSTATVLVWTSDYFSKLMKITAGHSIDTQFSTAIYVIARHCNECCSKHFHIKVFYYFSEVSLIWCTTLKQPPKGYLISTCISINRCHYSLFLWYCIFITSFKLWTMAQHQILGTAHKYLQIHALNEHLPNQTSLLVLLFTLLQLDYPYGY